MTDLVIKGTGNSRYLKSVSNFMTLYPTYADFVSALVAGTLPIDFNGINAAGIQTQGTPLNKANLLTDATATKYGQGSSATVNSILNAIPSGSFPNMSVGSATGATNAANATNATNATNTAFTNEAWTEVASMVGEVETIVSTMATFEVQVFDGSTWYEAPLLTVTSELAFYEAICWGDGTKYCRVQYSQEISSLRIQPGSTWTALTKWRYRRIR